MRSPALVLIPLVLLAVAAPVASAATPPRTDRLLSGGTSSAINPDFGGTMSKDGSRFVFSTTEALLPADQNAVSDVYARDRSGTLQLVSTGAAGASTSSFVGVSANGDRVWYITAGKDLPADTDTQNDIYERRRNGALRQISAGNLANTAQFAGASDNGDHVIWATAESVPGTGDADGQNDLYDRRGDGSIRLLTPGTTQGIQFFTNRLVVSADGGRVTFMTPESLVPSDTDLLQDSYSVSTAGGGYTLETPGTTDSTFATVNRAGTRAWFSTTSALLPADTDTAADVYERRNDGSIHLISGGTANTPAFLANTTDSGDNVIFQTTESLLPADANGTTDLYSRHADGSLHLISGGTTGSASLWMIDELGTAVFSTNQALVPSDIDGVSDIYDRRMNGTVDLLTPSTPAAVGFGGWVENIPADMPRATLTLSIDVPGTGDTNGVSDLYEVLPTGTLRRVGPSLPVFTGLAGYGQGPHGSRITFSTTATIPGTGDADTALDYYEADFAVPVIAGVPTMTGNGRVASTQSCSTPGVAGEGLTNTFSWFRDASAILGATAKTYVPKLTDAGHTLHCRFTSTNGIGTDTADSAARKVPPAAKSAKLGGFPIVGTNLSCTSFAGATRTTYKWKRGAKVVKGRTGRSYRVTATDLGKRVTCSAVAKNGTLSTSVTQKVTVPRSCKVPNVRGLTLADAKTRLGNAGCRSTTRRVSGSGVPVGRVLGTSPGKGKKLRNGARVTIKVRK